MDNHICSAFYYVTKNNLIPITDITPVQKTTSMRMRIIMRDKKCEDFLKQMKKEIITSSLTELSEACERCNISSLDELICATKEEPIF